MAADALLNFLGKRVGVAALESVLVQTKDIAGGFLVGEDLLVGPVTTVFRPERSSFFGNHLESKRTFLNLLTISSHGCVLVVKPFITRNDLQTGIHAVQVEFAVYGNSLPHTPSTEQH